MEKSTIMRSFASSPPELRERCPWTNVVRAQSHLELAKMAVFAGAVRFALWNPGRVDQLSRTVNGRLIRLLRCGFSLQEMNIRLVVLTVLRRLMSGLDFAVEDMRSQPRTYVLPQD